MPNPPWSRDAEVELLAAPLVDPTCLDTLAEMLRPSDFYLAAHRKTHEAQQAVWHQHAALDIPLLAAELERSGLIGDARAELLKLLDATCGSTHNIRRYATIVRDRATLRRLMATCESIAERAAAVPEDVDAFVCQAEGEIRGVAEAGAAGMLESADQGVHGALRFIEQARSGDATVLGLQTGFPRLDAETGGLPRGMTICMGRPANGKSAFAYQIARRVAQRGFGVFIWSGEMPSHKVWTRIFGCMGRACIRDLLTGVTPPLEQHAAIQDAAHAARELPIMLDCQPGLTAQQVCVRAQRARRDLARRGFKLRLVVVDHFNLLDHAQRKQEKEGSAMGRSSLAFANWAKEAEVSLVNCCQLNRDCTKRADTRPIMADIRECGKIEEDAELMLGMYIAQRHDKHARAGEAQVVICKNRMGNEASIPFYFDGPPNRFLEER